MAQKLFLFSRGMLLIAGLALTLGFSPMALAEEAVAEASKEAPTAPAAAKDAAKEAAKPAEKPLSEAEKKAAIEAADSITAFDAGKVIGMAKPWQIYYQEASTPNKHALEKLHDVVLVIITLITLFVLGLMIYVMVRFNKKSNPKPQTFTHNKLVEVIWTVIPIMILVGIAIPSIRAHYNLYYNEDALQRPDMTIKVVGHQWYWEYEYPDHGIKFDSNLTPEKDLAPGAPRLLEVDNPVVVPVGKTVRVQITAADVMHAWVVPAFGVKKGAVPGRLNETWFKAEKEGIFYGQCSILCGKLHGYMPVKVVVVSQEQFDQWVKGARVKFAANDSYQFASIH